MTATDCNSGDSTPAPERSAHRIDAHERDSTVVHVDHTCQVAASGRRAARWLADWAKEFALTEAEFQVLWRLRAAPSDGIDQTALANALAFSPAQISGSVERLRSQGLICVRTAPGDRRRRHRHLTAAGCEFLDKMLRVRASAARS